MDNTDSERKAKRKENWGLLFAGVVLAFLAQTVYDLVRAYLANSNLSPLDVIGVAATVLAIILGILYFGMGKMLKI